MSRPVRFWARALAALALAAGLAAGFSPPAAGHTLSRPVRPSQEEVKRNPRARSAKLRVLERSLA